MSVRWETEGLQTVGIVCLVIMFLKLMHLLGLIDITETGEKTWHRRCNGGTGERRMQYKEKYFDFLMQLHKMLVRIFVGWKFHRFSCNKSNLLSKGSTYLKRVCCSARLIHTKPKRFYFCSGCGVNHRDYLEGNLLSFLILN